MNSVKTNILANFVGRIWGALLGILFVILTNYFTSILTSLKYFTVPMIVSVINSLFVIAAIVLLHKNFDVVDHFLLASEISERERAQSLLDFFFFGVEVFAFEVVFAHLSFVIF